MAIDDLQKATTYHKEVLEATPQNHPKLATRLSLLASALNFRYHETGAMEDLQNSILYIKEALEATPKDHPDRVNHLQNLAASLNSRYARTGAMDDLQQALLQSEEALAAIPHDHPKRAICLNDLSITLHYRYEETGSIDDQQQAISYGEEALAAIPQNHPDRVRYLDSLAIKLSSRYNRTGVMGDLQRAIIYAKEALAIIPQDHPERAGRLNSMANRLRNRYDRTKDTGDLEQTLSYSKEAVAATPKDHPSRATYLNGLAIAFNSRYEQTLNGVMEGLDGAIEDFDGAMEDLKQAILYGEEALAITPQGHPIRAKHLNNLVKMLGSRYQLTEATSDLQQATLYAEEVVAITPHNHPERAFFLYNLGNLFVIKWQTKGISPTSKDIENCILRFKESVECSTSPPFIRIISARWFSYIFYEYRKYVYESHHLKLEQPSSVLEKAVLLLPKASPRSLERQDQQYSLLNLNGLAAQAASSALEEGKPAYDALKLLELSRGIIMGFTIDCRGDLSELKETDPVLFKKFNDLRTEIDTLLPGEAMIGDQVQTHITRRREKAAYEIEETLAQIRNLPGHEGFQLPPSPTELMSMAKDGPIVIFTSSSFRSDAIIVTSSTITSILLPKLIFSEIPGQLEVITELSTGIQSLRTYGSLNKKMRKLLLWLWDVAVEPVIQKLQLTTQSEPTHIWWIGVGRLNMAPFHAAGDYSPGADPHKNILNYAISTYTPSIKALSYAREKDFTIADNHNSDSAQLLLVTMSKTPKNKDLPDVEEEVAKISEIAKGLVSTEHLQQPSTKDILDRLQLGSFHAIHFACHGISDEKDPSNSHLTLLKDGTDDTTDKLTVQDISRKINTGIAQLAYLSACSTANSLATNLADETIHIASGFQLAGFNHVLATMWPSNSKVCKEVSTNFYHSLFDSSQGVQGHRKVRIAFHEAVKMAQAKYLHQPLKWAPFIHMGA